mgnify:CR=1 FL=1
MPCGAWAAACAIRAWYSAMKSIGSIIKAHKRCRAENGDLVFRMQQEIFARGIHGLEFTRTRDRFALPYGAAALQAPTDRA